MSMEPITTEAREKAPFIHLHCHSHYSLLDGLSKIPQLVKKAKEFGMPALALTDHGAMYGAVEFYKECKKAGIKPIIGVEAYMAERSRFDKDSSLDSKRYHLTLLAKNTVGYHNLIRLVSRSYMEGFYYKPRMDEELLKEFSEGIICLTGCPGSRFIQALKNNNEAEARRLLTYYIQTFGTEHVFVEVMNHPEVAWYMPLVPQIRALAEEYGLPITATWDSHYISRDDKEAHATLLHINTQGSDMKMEGDYSFISTDEAYEIFADMPEAVAQTSSIADLVDIQLDLDDWHFPAFTLPGNVTADEELKNETYKYAHERGFELTPELVKRIEYELEVIRAKGYSSYFLCMADFTRHARTVGILTNTRGSAAGSMVSYLIGITTINPMEFNLPFERFLNPERPSLPDIDLDIADDRRDDLIDYARQKYGKEAVAQIGTFGKMLARGVVRDVARAMGYPYSTGDRLAKIIPFGAQGFPMTIERAFKEVPELDAMYQNENDIRTIIDMSKKLEGCVRHISVHAAGIVISPTGHIDDFSPIQYDPKGGEHIITQYDMYTGGRDGILNLPKFDFLGIRNLSILADSIVRVEKIRNISIDVDTIPSNDALTFEMLARGETTGLFQLAGDGMTRWLKELRPSTIHDINAMVALYRPGPMEIIPEYIERKHDASKIKYVDERTKEFLDRSYGLIVYQDDVMLTAIHLAGYSWLEADMLRKAMGKKIPELMAEQKVKLTEGLLAHGKEFGMTQEKADYIWSLIEPFAAYGFNKAHAASYGQLAYRTAYMKANYPAEYMTAVMTAESGNLEEVASIIEECKRMGFEILPPDINESFSDFTVVVEPIPTPLEERDIENHFHPQGDYTEDGRRITNKIRFGLNNIKNFGEEIGKAIIRERKERGVYTSLLNFLERVQHRNLNKKSLESLIVAGALDSLGERGHMLANIETMLAFSRDIREDATSNQSSLFANLSVQPRAHLTLVDADPMPAKEKLIHEKELLGLYLTGHPLDQHAEKLSKASFSIASVFKELKPGYTVTLAGMIDQIREIVTKKNEKMAFARIQDLTGSIELVFFPKTYRMYKRFLKQDAIIACKGTISERNGTRSIMAEEMRVM